MPTFTQAHRLAEVTTPLGKDVLLLARFAGYEAVSQLFSFQLDMLAENGTDIAFDKLLGQKVTVQVPMRDGKPRFFNGICKRFSQGESDEVFTDYRMEVVPQLWLLTKRAQSRIFQHLSVPDILKKVLAGLDVSFELQGTFQPRDFCVQYRETDFNFASRLMEEEGIYYFFKHSADAHKMVLANTPGSHPDVPAPSKVLYEDIEGGTRDEDRIHDWAKVQELRSGKYTLFDHCFELPHKHLEAEKAIQDSVQVGQVSHKLKVGDNGKLELYAYPGEYAQRFDGVQAGGGEQPAELQKIFEDNKRTVEIRMQEETTPAVVIQGAGDCRQFIAGHKFTLAVLPADKVAKLLKAEGQYVLTGVRHFVEVSGYRSSESSRLAYHNSFTCVPLALPFRPARATPKPFVQGSQTAVVVGPAGQEIFTDKYGRVKVQFHWDREGKNNVDSSCWVRVGQLWAGKRWGASFWPRIGQEVIVDFLEGDPDCPIIIGSVYNADQMPPYLGEGLDPKHKNDNKLCGVKSNTTPGGVGFNEWRFDDNKGKEQVFFHAERNMDTRVKNDSMELVLHDRHLIVGAEKDGKKAGDQVEKVFQDKHLRVQRHQAEWVEGNLQLTVGKGQADGGGHVDIVIEKDKKELIEMDDHLHVKCAQATKVGGAQSLAVGGDRKEKIGGADHLEVCKDQFVKIHAANHVDVGKDQNIKLGLGHSLNVGTTQNVKVGTSSALEAGTTVHIKAGTTLVLEAGVQLSLKVGGNFIDISSAGVAIQGTMVMINSGGAAGSGTGASPTAPTAPQAPAAPKDAKKAEPKDPAVADDSKSGQKSAPS